MKNKLLKYSILGFFIISILGTTLHFTYELSGNNTYVATFSAVNESVWEHLKLGVFGLLFYTIFEHTKLGKTKGYMFSKLIAIIAQIITIITVFYTYTSIVGRSIIWVDISTFFIAVLLGQILSYISLKKGYNFSHSFALILLIIYMFITFTFCPPQKEIFRDSVTGKYGINIIKTI